MQWTGTPYTVTRKGKPTVLGTGMKKAQGIMGAQKEETDLGQGEERLEWDEEKSGKQRMFQSEEKTQRWNILQCCSEIRI